MSWHNALLWGLALLVSLGSSGCALLIPADRSPPPKLPPDPEKGWLVDNYVPGEDDQPRAIGVAIEQAPALPESGPIHLSLADCQQRAKLAGRLDGESVYAWRLTRKVEELSTHPGGGRYTIEVLRARLGQQRSARILNMGYRLAVLEFQHKLARLALAVDLAAWRLRCIQRGPADALSEREEARIALGQLIGLTTEQSCRLVLAEMPLPTIPPQPELLLLAAADRHPKQQIVCIREDLERQAREAGQNDGLLENRLHWIRAQQAVEDTRTNLRAEGERLLRRWHQAKRRNVECDVGLAQIELSHYLAWSQGECPGSCLQPQN